MHQKYVAAKENLNRIQVQIQQSPLNEELYKAEQDAWDTFNLWKSRMESFYIQKSKEEWLNLGDSNDKYFFEKLKQRHHYNMISSFQMKNGQWSWDYTKVTEHFVQFYENFLGAPAITHVNIDDQIIAMGPCLSIS